MSVKLTLGVKGFFKFVLHEGMVDEDGNPMFDERGVPMVVPGTDRVALDWFPNTILNAGREYMGDNSNFAGAGSWCQVGTNGTPPIPTENGLGAWFASTNVVEAQSNNQQGTAPFYGWDRETYRFALGATAAILKEVGIGWGAGPSPQDCFARTLTVDPSGVPTDVIPLITEVLDVLYELRYYPPLGDVAGTVVLDGLTYDTITRASSVTGSDWSASIGTQVTDVNYSFSFGAYEGELGTIEQGPSGPDVEDIDGTPFPQAYGPNTFYRDIVAPCGLNGWNVDNGIRSIVCTTTGGKFQTRFGRQGGGDETIPKTIAQTLSITWRISWAGWLFDGPWTRGADSDVDLPSLQIWNTNTAKTLLRISWTDGDAGDRQGELQVPNDTLFHMQYDADPAIWIEFTMTPATSWSEGTNWTEYTGTITATGPDGAPSTGNVCTIRAQTP